MGRRKRRGEQSRNYKRERLPDACPACGKVPYATKQDASRVRASETRRLGLEPGELTTYRCASGNKMFHVGHAHETRTMRGEKYKPKPKNRRNSYRKDTP